MPLPRRALFASRSDSGYDLSGMIRNYTDHSANERTFLAWVRTAIALMAFGFLLERFDLYLQIAVVTLGPNAPHIPANGFGREAGLALLLLGVAMTAIAAIRFLKTRKAIDSPELRAVTGLRLDVALAALLVLLGLSLVFYLAHAIVSHV
jgi:putative membrane protein